MATRGEATGSRYLDLGFRSTDCFHVTAKLLLDHERVLDRALAIIIDSCRKEPALRVTRL